MDLCKIAFSIFGLNWEEHTIQDTSLYRPSEIMSSRSEPKKAKKMLGWVAETKMEGAKENIINTDLETF